MSICSRRTDAATGRHRAASGICKRLVDAESHSKKTNYLSRENYLGNHFNIPKDKIELFEDLFVGLA